MDLNVSMSEQDSKTAEPTVAAAANVPAPPKPEVHNEREELLTRLWANLKNAEKELDAFSHTASHDFRGHLRGISVSVHEVLTNHLNHLEPSSREELIKIGEEVKHMGHMIDSMLRLSALTRADVKKEDFDMSSLARRIAAEVFDRNPIKELKGSIQERLVTFGDERLVAAALEKLFENACKYVMKTSNPQVEFGMAVMNGKKTYFVKDNGPGFPQQQALRIFEPMEKMGHQQGTGTDLNSVKRIIERHGGKVWAHSAVGQGATFSFTLLELA